MDEFQFGLERLDLRVNPDDVKLLFSRYDSDEDGRLGFWEFSNMVLPLDVRQRDEVEQRPNYGNLSYETQSTFKRVLKQSIDNELLMERVRMNIGRGLGIPLRQAFENIDWINRGYINKGDIKRLVDTYSEHVSQVTADQRSHPGSIEMEALTRRFNKDKQNGKIALPEWIDELTPKLR